MKSWRWISFCLLAGSLPLQAQEVLRVYNWADYLAPEVLEDFQGSHDVRVDYRTFTDATELEDALRRGEQFDLVFPADHQLHELVRDGLLAPLQPEHLHKRGNLDPYLLRLLAASGAEQHVIPYMWGSVGLMINQPLAERHYGGPLPNSWSLLFDRQASDRLSACGVAILNARQEAISLKLTYKGLRLGNSGARRIRAEVAELLNPGARLSPSDYSQYSEQMARGELCVAMTWDALLRGEDLAQRGLRFSIPVEGGLIFIDSMAIPSTARQPRLAHALIDFLLDPVNVARNARVSHATPGIRAQLLHGTDATPGLGLDPETRRRLYLLDPLSSKQREALQAAWPPTATD